MTLPLVEIFAPEMVNTPAAVEETVTPPAPTVMPAAPSAVFRSVT